MLIKQPQDFSANTPNGSLALKWNKSFGIVSSDRLQKAQKFIDSECIRLMKPYTPFRNGVLEQTATLGTVIGSGEIRQIAPYAHYMYYGKVYGPNIPIFENAEVVGFWSKPNQRKYPTGADIKYDTTKHKLAGPKWFDRMKADHGNEILKGAAEIAGGTAK